MLEIIASLWRENSSRDLKTELCTRVLKGRHTLGDKLQEHVAATDHSICTGLATTCSNKVRRHVAAANRFLCTGEFLWKSSPPQQNFVASTSRNDSNHTESVRLVAATNSVAATKIFAKILQYTRSDLPLQYVAATCCCNLSPIVYRTLELCSRSESWSWSSVWIECRSSNFYANWCRWIL